MAMPKHVTHLGRCAFQWANERYVDVNLLLATPGRPTDLVILDPTFFCQSFLAYGARGRVVSGKR
jgi:hypothetical protein